MSSIGLGIQLWAQHTDWGPFLAAARRVDELGYDHLWTWDHLVAAVGDPDRPVFEGYTTLAAGKIYHSGYGAQEREAREFDAWGPAGGVGAQPPAGDQGRVPEGLQKSV